jgi:diaminohydroxyphosphoribosylaminopyrimidine deaminase/5-amino-6-(5-phosphoribosylamino)uracil reductase
VQFLRRQYSLDKKKKIPPTFCCSFAPLQSGAFIMDHKFYMQRAISLATQGQGLVHPNPLVGAVIVKDDQIIGEGFHQVYGGPHAEIVALTQATRDVTGATMYVTLEPCSHHGKTPPCVNAIIDSGIAEVFIAMQDPNPLVYGKGILALKEAGIHVQTGILKKQAKELNERFIHFIKTKRPFVIVKSAISANQKITSASGPWVTSEASRTRVHELRAATTAVMVSVATVLADDPMLNVRHVTTSKQPVRIILDSLGRTPIQAKLVQTASQIPTIIYVKQGVDAGWKASVETMQVEVVEIETPEERLPLSLVFAHLGLRLIDEVLIEPGSRLLQTLISEKWINRWIVFQSDVVEPEDQISLLPYVYDIAKHYNLQHKESIGNDTCSTYVPKEVQ